MQKLKIYAPIITVFILLIIGAISLNFYDSKKKSKGSSSKIQITTSFYPLYFFSSRIGGEKAEVTNITPTGAEPHDYEPSAQQIAKMQDSKILVLNGSVEAWGDSIQDELKNSDVLVITAGSDLLTKQINEDGNTIKDPHVWLDPVLAKKEVNKILEGFIKVDPANTDYYEQNANKLKTDLDQINNEYRAGLASCKKKDFVTSHAAFAYLADEYNLNQVAIAGISPDEEPSSQRLAEVSDFVKQNQIKYIFFESLVSPKFSETIANETDAGTLVLDPLEGIPDKDLENGVNYITVMNSNLKNLEIALECIQ